MNSAQANLPDWVAEIGPEADVVISTRARLARSLTNFPFPARADSEDLKTIARLVRQACTGLTSKFPHLRSFRVERLSPAQKCFLLDARVASVEQVFGGEGRVVVTEPTGTLSLMVNEEDHLRIQVMLPGLDCRRAWEIADWVDDALSQKLDYGFSDQYGYLTASVTNVGTGLRMSAMMHLAGLAETGGLKERLRAAYELGVSVRGAFGEGSPGAGDIYQVSNEATLGMPESEIVEKVRSVAQYLLSEERRARNELLEGASERLSADARRALQTLSSAMSVKSGQAAALISRIRLAVAIGLIRDYSLPMANELLIGVQAAAGDDGAACIERATLLRHMLRKRWLISNA